MSQKPNPTLIGLFIVLGIALGATGLFLFGSSKLFIKTTDVIVYFDESLNGLDEGAPVKYRGVIIGSVKRVMVHFNQATNDYSMPVILELQHHLLHRRLREPGETFSEASIKARVNGGLRASLETDSLVTGVLYVDISPRPNAAEPRFHQLEKTYPEVPSQPTQIQQLFNNLASLDVQAITTNVSALVDKLDIVLSNLRTGEMSTAVTNTLASLNQLITSPEITNILAGARTTMDQYRVLADSLTNSLAEANHTLAQLRGTADNLRSMLRPDAPLEHDLEQLLQQLAGTAESVSTLVEFLKQHPNALLTGREASQKP